MTTMTTPHSKRAAPRSKRSAKAGRRETPDSLDRRQLLAALRAFKRGDFSVRLPESFDGIDGQICSTFNDIAQSTAQLSEETRTLARGVCEDGRTKQRLRKNGLRGSWGEIVDSQNRILDGLTSHMSEISRVVTAVSEGTLRERMDEVGDEQPVRGQFLRNARAVNGMVDQLGWLNAELTRVAQEVGVEGQLGAQAKVRGVGGAWKDLADAVNLMASSLTGQVREIARVTTAVAQGDLTKTINIEVRGEILELKNTINTMVDQLGSFADEVTRVAREVGSEGILGGQARVRGVSGVWRELTENVNGMANNLTGQVRNIAEVATAIAGGDLSRKITVDAQGEILELKNTINTMVDQLGSFADEVTRVAREVGTDGVLGGEAEVTGVSGVWRELTENVNGMANNLTDQVRNIAEVVTAIAEGDLSRKITVDARGEILALKNTINATVDKLNRFSAEVTRVARLVGTEGTLGVQAEVRDVSGIWKELTDNVNLMASNLTDQVRDIAEVTTAVANGNLSRKITVEVRGEILELKNTINAMVDQLGSFADEVSRMARDVGSEGVLGGQAVVRDVSGIWEELTDNVNNMASNLTNQVRNITEVARAVASGDLSKKITVNARGEVQDLKETINAMVDQLNAFAAEVSQVARDVGVEGKLGGQAFIAGVQGVWKELTDNVNMMANNLTNQVRDIAEVTTAVAKGDLTRKIVVDARGEILELKNTINTMVDQLGSFADEVTRLASEVGIQGRLGGQADVRGVSGTWRDLTDAVNSMANNLTNQVRNISQVATAIAQGDLEKKIQVDASGEILQLKNTINAMVDQLSAFAEQVTRVAREVGTEGKLGGQASVEGVRGIWKELTDNVNLMASNLTDQVRDIAEVTTAVANGNLSRKITVEVRGEIAELKNTVNTMVDQLSAFAAEVTRVAREVGTEGMLGGQAEVTGVSGIWKELTDNVNVMARNLTEQVRGIASVVTAVANGDLRQRLQLAASGEIATLVDTINNMTDTLSTFADQVTDVARAVGVEGILGGQADVPGAAGIWRNLTNNVNELAGNLTRQVRAIGDVATAVTKGDLTQSISVEARGEVAALKDNLNQMILTLAETTRVNQEQDWLKTNLTRFTRMLQGQRDLLTVARQVLSELAPTVGAQHGVFYMAEPKQQEVELKLFASYAYRNRKHMAGTFKMGEGLVGQAALERQRIVVRDVPDNYVQVNSALGEAPPRNLAVVPILFEDEVKGVIELASLQEFTPIQLAFLEQLLESLGIVVATIEAQMRTDELLRQSQSLAEELQTQQEELQQTNEELEEKARQLTAQKSEVERKNQDVEVARQELEEKAEQLALTSRYKNEFLANMSHELRTPLNSLLILSKQLAGNPDGNLEVKQVEYAQTIHSAGADLLDLINEILDLAKIESGTMAVSITEISFGDLASHLRRQFSQVAEDNHLSFAVELDDDLPETLVSDEMRLKQVLRNLLSNAFKFTDSGGVELEIRQENDGMIAFTVTDTGIGIAPEQHRLIFEAFQQADGGANRKYGGTGLGLSISREIAALLGGGLSMTSEEGKGSSFTLRIPRTLDVHSSNGHRRRRSGGTRAPQALPAPVPLDARPSARPVRLVDGKLARRVLVIEGDEELAELVSDQAYEAGFEVLVASDGEEALSQALEVAPDAILLDVDLPDMDGWVLLDRFKHDPRARHVPVVLVDAPESFLRGREHGALDMLAKPPSLSDVTGALARIREFLDSSPRRLLIVEDDAAERDTIADLIAGQGVTSTAVASAEAALAAMSSERFDCMVLDLHSPETTSLQLIEQLKGRPTSESPPVVIYSDSDLTQEQEIALRALADRAVIKSVCSRERLLAETSTFLHRSAEQLPEPQRQILRDLDRKDPILAGKKVLVVDDDVRNIFAITSVLEGYSMKVVYAENGADALETLEREAGVDIVLMDIMMPEMDGYEATRRIRMNGAMDGLPIIALTAKAMKGDREKCIEAGASDYITKPIDTEQLVSLLRVWLERR